MVSLAERAEAESGGYPWQRLTLDSGLMLHAPFWDMRPHLPALQAEFAAVDVAAAVTEPARRETDGGWSSITLVQRSRDAVSGTPAPALALMPTLRDLLAGSGWVVLGSYLTRQPPGGCLAWHTEDQAPYSSETRVIVPILAPPGARTLVSHEETAYPAGLGWVGDVNFPHQVENPTAEQRVVMLIDVVSGPDLHRRVPPELIDQLPRRHDLAGQARNQLLQWRASCGREDLRYSGGVSR